MESGGPARWGGSGPVRVRLVAPARARAGEAVPLVIEVSNPGPRSVGLATLGREVAFDFEVVGPAGTDWRRLAGRTIPMVLRVRILAPGGSFELRDDWRADVGPGSYRIEARVLTDGDPLEAPSVSIVIAAG